MVKRMQHIGMFLHNEMGISWGGISPMCGHSSIYLQKIFFLRSIEALDLLLVMVATSRMVRRDGVHFQGLRYMDPTLAAYVGEPVTIRYDPRDLAEIRVFHRHRFLCRAINAEHAGRTMTLKDLQTARVRHRRTLRTAMHERIARVADFLPEQAPSNRPAQKAAATQRRSAPKLYTYLEDKT